MCDFLSTKSSEICNNYLSTTYCRSAASGKLIFEINYQIPHIQYRYFRSSVQSNDGSYDVRDIDIPIQIVIGNTLQGVIMVIQSGLIKYEIW